LVTASASRIFCDGQRNAEILNPGNKELSQSSATRNFLSLAACHLFIFGDGQHNAEMLNPGNKELSQTRATRIFLSLAVCQCNAHLFIFGDGQCNAKMLNPGNRELGGTSATCIFLSLAACQCNAHLFIFGDGQRNAEMLNPGNKELGETRATRNFLSLAACQCNAHLFIFDGEPVQRGNFEIQEETRIFYLFDVSVQACVQRDSVGGHGLLSLGNGIFGRRPVQRASFISLTCQYQPAPNVTVSASVGTSICIRISNCVLVKKVVLSVSNAHYMYTYI